LIFKIKQIPYDNIKVGNTAIMQKTILAKDVESFAKIVNDKESFHVNDEIAKQLSFKKRIFYGLKCCFLINHSK